jgi:ATPase subunit of ABC transporter with duplicated ATPase domains
VHFFRGVFQRQEDHFHQSYRAKISREYGRWEQQQEQRQRLEQRLEEQRLAEERGVQHGGVQRGAKKMSMLERIQGMKKQREQEQEQEQRRTEQPPPPPPPPPPPTTAQEEIEIIKGQIAAGDYSRAPELPGLQQVLEGD